MKKLLDALMRAGAPTNPATASSHRRPLGSRERDNCFPAAITPADGCYPNPDAAGDPCFPEPASAPPRLRADRPS